MLIRIAVTIFVGIMTMAVDVEIIISHLVMALAEAGVKKAETGMMAMNGAEIGARLNFFRKKSGGKFGGFVRSSYLCTRKFGIWRSW